MVIVDAHTHVHRHWFEPVESLIYQMDRNGVKHAVLIQDLDETNNEYQFECLRQFPGRFASVVYVDTSRPEASQELERLAELGAVGVRWRVNTRSPGSDPLAIWRTAERLGLAISCPGTGSDWASEETYRLLQAVPKLQVVMEHLGLSRYDPNREPAPVEMCRRTYSRLASLPNVYIKVHGLGEFCRRAVPHTEPFPFEVPIPPLLELAYEAFGPSRMMWGSDYPPVGIREGYRNSLRFTMDQFATKSEEDRRLIFGGTALAVFPIHE